jgi:uncharacterized protein
MDTMKILCISDIHGQFGDFVPPLLPEADLALICGDFTNLGIRLPLEVAAAKRWMAQLAARYPRVLYVLGNHDLGLKDPCFEGEGPGIQNVVRKVTIYGDYRIVGADLSPCFDVPEMADDWERMTPREDVDAAYFDSLEAADIVISHCPPFGLLDEYRRPDSHPQDAGTRHLGSPGLRRYIKRVQPLLVVCGHIHEGSGEAMVGKTRILNVARRYQLVEIEGSTS